jgi:integrase
MLMSSKKHQLFSLLPEGFFLPAHVDYHSAVNTREADNLPFMYWPNRVPCFEANAYMIKLWKQGKSRRNRGGTLAEYAKNISPLLRFCYNNSVSLIDMSDNRFAQFIRGLQVRNSKGEQQRSINEIIKIGRKCIDFFLFISELNHSSNFIGEDGCRLTVTQQEFQIRREGKRSIIRKYWVHESLPDPDPVRRRLPISLEVVQAIKNEIQKVQDKGLRLRKELMIACFEQTGGRRFEVSEIQVKNVEAASQSYGSAPLLAMLTVKGGNNREVPVPRVFIEQAMRYIKRIRRKIIRSTIGTANDHGYLLISHTTGKPLKPDTMTTQLHDLCVAAGVDDQPGHLHLFRHSYITQKFVAAIEHYNLTNTDEFRKALLSTSKLKLELQQWTGHKNIDSLDVYINLAFNEITHMSRVYSAISLGAAVGVALDRVDNLRAELANGIKAADILDEFESMLKAFQEDVGSSIDQSKTSDN